MVTCGFYNSFNHDRKYDAEPFGSMFDGVIKDGIFMSIGTCFRVIPAENMTVIVGVGKAWFDHSFTKNDAPLPMDIQQSDLLLDRIDAIVIDVNGNREVRNNDIIIIKGTPSKTPQRPILINNARRHQYPLAYISVRAGVTSIRAADITSMVGTSSAPYITGILDTVDIDALVDQWGDQFNEWFDTVKDLLDEDTAAKLAKRISELETKVDSFTTNMTKTEAKVPLNVGTDWIVVNTPEGTKGLLPPNLKTEVFKYTNGNEIFDIADKIAGPTLRRNIWRGRNLGSAPTSEQKNNIANGTFKGLFVGDYWKDQNSITWRIVDFNYWPLAYMSYSNTINVAPPHLVIMPDSTIGDPKMMSPSTSTPVNNGYGNSYGRSSVNGSNSETRRIIEQVFSNKAILRQKADFDNAISSDGTPIGYGIYIADIELPSECMIFGNQIASPISKYELTDGTIGRFVDLTETQFAAFMLKPNLIASAERTGSSSIYWLRNSAAKTKWVSVYGASRQSMETNELAGIRPFFGYTGNDYYT